MTADYWDHLTLKIKDGHLSVEPLHWGLVPEEYRYTVLARDVRMLWAAPDPQTVLSQPSEQINPAVSAQTPTDPKDWIIAAIKQRKSRERVTDFAKRVEPEMKKAYKAGTCRGAWAWRTIVNRVNDYNSRPK